MTLNLSEYLQKIGLPLHLEADEATLRQIILGHATTFPFENIDSFCGRVPSIELPQIAEKFLHQNRGGYCFEQNLLLKAVLEGLGFKITALAARVCYQAPDDTLRARTHMALLARQVSTEQGKPQDLLIDVGFGGATPTGPISLHSRAPAQTPHEPYRLQKNGDIYTLEINRKQRWNCIYTFDLWPQEPVDYKIANWYIATNPGSHFRHRLTVTRVDPKRRFALRDNHLAIHQSGRDSEHRELTNFSELLQTLNDIFRIRVPSDSTTKERLASIFEQN